ncbi:MAG: RidA family protein [Parasphingorhabdus sp.]|uniref:RidA family protein n=1 Tax=Parasphingorhabdus sp. TaxID=2709688 RepID=UPI003298389F
MKTILTSWAAAMAIIAAAPAAQAEPKQTLMPDSEQGRAFMEQFGFSEAVIHKDTVYLSGVIAGPTPEGMTDEESYARTFAYLGTILKRAGSSWDDVIDITTYHVDIEQSMPPLAAAKNRFVKAPFPAWTAIDIDRLFTPDGLVEIKITARLTPKDSKPAE